MSAVSTSDGILDYTELDRRIIIDYIYVTKRRQGTGTFLVEQLKAMGKPLHAEVTSDSREFWLANGFVPNYGRQYVWQPET